LRDLIRANVRFGSKLGTRDGRWLMSGSPPENSRRADIGGRLKRATSGCEQKQRTVRAVLLGCPEGDKLRLLVLLCYSMTTSVRANSTLQEDYRAKNWIGKPLGAYLGLDPDNKADRFRLQNARP